MRFRVTLNHNNSSVGDVFYTIPTEEEMKKAEKIIIDICNERLAEVYKANTQEDQKNIWDYFNNEIERICATETAYHFLILILYDDAFYPLEARTMDISRIQKKQKVKL